MLLKYLYATFSRFFFSYIIESCRYASDIALSFLYLIDVAIALLKKEIALSKSFFSKLIFPNDISD